MFWQGYDITVYKMINSNTEDRKKCGLTNYESRTRVFIITNISHTLLNMDTLQNKLIS